MKIKSLMLVAFFSITACSSNYQLGQNAPRAFGITNSDDPPPPPCLHGETNPNCVPVHPGVPVGPLNPPEQYYKYVNGDLYESYEPNLKQGDKLTYEIKSQKYPNIQKTTKATIEILKRVENTVTYKYTLGNHVETHSYGNIDMALYTLSRNILIDGVLPEKKTDVGQGPGDLSYQLHFCKDQQMCTENVNFQGKNYEALPIIRTDQEIFKKAWTFAQNPISYVSQFTFAKGIGIINGKTKYRIPNTNNFNEAEFQLQNFSRGH